VLDLVARVLEIEVVKEFVGLALDILEVDFELEFAPAILCYSEGGILENCMTPNVRRTAWRMSGSRERGLTLLGSIAKRLVEVVCRL